MGSFIQISELNETRKQSVRRVDPLVTPNPSNTNMLVDDIPSPDGFLYQGTFLKPRFRDGDTRVVLYPTSSPPLSNFTENELSSVFGGNRSLFQMRKSFLTHFRSHHSSDRILLVLNCVSGSERACTFYKRRYIPLFAAIFPHDFDLLLLGPHFDLKRFTLSSEFVESSLFDYRTLHLAITLFPPSEFRYAGVLYLTDSSYIDPQLFGSLDLQSSWSGSFQLLDRSFQNPLNSQRNAMNVSYSRAFMEAGDAISGKPDFEKQCRFSSGAVLGFGVSDFWYISGKDIDLAVQFEDVAFRHRVPSSFVIPTLMHCLNQRTIVDCGPGHMGNVEQCVHLFPLNMTLASNQQFVIRRIKREPMTLSPFL